MELKIHFAILPTLGIPVERREPDRGRNGQEKDSERGKPRTEEGTGQGKKPDGGRNREEKNRTEQKNREAKRTGRFLG